MARKKTAKKETTTAKKKKLETLTETDGMSVAEDKYAPSSLDQVWGDDGMSKYNTLSTKKYDEKLKDMSKADLKQEAIRVGLLPVDNMDQLKLRLRKQFKVHASGYKRPFTSYTPTKVTKEVQKILDEGK